MEHITSYILNHSKPTERVRIPVTGKQIADAYGCSGIEVRAEVRAMVNQARRNGDPICANSRGYFIAEDAEDVEAMIASLNNRISAMTAARDGLRRYLLEQAG